MITEWGGQIAGYVDAWTLLSGNQDISGQSSKLSPGLIANGIACISFATGLQAGLSFATGVEAAITFATGTQAGIVFGEGSCQ